MALFEQNGTQWTNKALDLDRRVMELLRPLIEQAVADGENIREVGSVIHSSTEAILTETILGIRFKKP